MARDICVFEHVRGCGRVCWPSFRSPGCLLVGDLCGAGVGLLSVRGCGLRWWPLTWSSRVTVRRGLRVGEAAPRWCEAVGEAVGCWRDTERCVIVTQHVVGWGGKHPNTRENTKEHEGVGEARYAINPRHLTKTHPYSRTWWAIMLPLRWWKSTA